MSAEKNNKKKKDEWRVVLLPGRRGKVRNFRVTRRQVRALVVFFVGGMLRLRAILALGRIAHDSVLTALGERPARRRFAHGAQHRIGDLVLYDSYHCSRYNTNTGRLTPTMFRMVFAAIRADLGPSPAPADPSGGHT